MLVLSSGLGPDVLRHNIPTLSTGRRIQVNTPTILRRGIRSPSDLRKTLAVLMQHHKRKDDAKDGGGGKGSRLA